MISNFSFIMLRLNVKFFKDSHEEKAISGVINDSLSIYPQSVSLFLMVYKLKTTEWVLTVSLAKLEELEALELAEDLYPELFP